LIEINTYEEKFLDILKGVSSLAKFEKWLYKNEEVLTSQLQSEIYNDLILLNYKTKESKHELAKALNIDYEILELYEIQRILKSELQEEPILNNVKYEIDVYELDFISFDFQIGTVKFRMHNPFKMENFASLNDAERVNCFFEQFGSGKLFLNSLLSSIGTKHLRVHNWKKYEQTNIMTETKIIQTKEDEYKILISGHYCYINKEYIKDKMKRAWL